VGINTGVVFMGTVGSEKVADITALGDEMNVAARLSSVAEVGDLVVSDATWRAIGDVALQRRLAAEPTTVTLKGKREPQTVHVSRAGRRAS
jgi:adenylate cyclase